jgi:hypothetical protein
VPDFSGYRGQVEERFFRREESFGHISAIYLAFSRTICRMIGDEDNRKPPAWASLL